MQQCGKTDAEAGYAPSIPRPSDSIGAPPPGTVGFRGDDGDFLGQYHRNSFALLALRYSF